MTATTLSDLIVPELFTPYVTEKTAEKSAFFQSGAVRELPSLTAGNKGGQMVNLPYFQDLSGSDNLLDEGLDITPAAINAEADIAVIHAREKAWGATDLARAFSGSDPIGAVADLVAGFWARRMQALLISSLNGAMANVTDNLLDISGNADPACNIDGASFIDACQKMGDAKDRITAVAMHSAVEASLAKADVIDYLPASEGRTQIPYFMGKRVIVDDNMPLSGDVYTTYLFGEGAVAYADAGTPVATEVHRDPSSAGGQDQLFTRRHFILHPRGVAFTPDAGVPALATPSNAELADSVNWTQKYESKNVRIVQFKHKISA